MRLSWIRIAVAVIAVGGSVSASMAEEEAKLEAGFVGEGTYSPTTGCSKLLAIEKGEAAPNIATYPLSMTAKGTRSWEGGCDYSHIKDTGNNVYEVKLKCVEGAEEYDDAAVFTRLDADRIEVKSGEDKLVYVRCKALKGN